MSIEHHRQEDRPTAEEMLERIRDEPGSGARGRHRIYLGMAPGVGKTVAALHELHLRKARGDDVVIAIVETYHRPYTIAAVGDLEVVPRKQIAHKGVVLEEMDTDAVLRRHPDLALVDEIAHTNADGMRHQKRWEDVRELLDAGISVISTVNVQHLETLADIVESITGVLVRERIPDRVVDEADELELVDLSPHALRRRVREGNVYPRDGAERALRHYFREGNLTALRELALRKVSTEVERDLEEYMHEHHVQSVWPAAERVMVAIDDQPHTQTLLRRGLRRAQRQQSALLAVFVELPDWEDSSEEQRQRLEDNVRFAADVGAEVLRIRDDEVAPALVRVAHEQNVGTIVIGHSRHGRLHHLVRGSTLHQLLSLARDVDVLVVADRAPQPSER